MVTTQSSTRRSPYRRRRIIWAILLFTVGSLFYLCTRPESSLGFGSWSLPSYLKDIGLSSSSSRARVVADAKAHESLEAGRPHVQEIQGLLHFVTAYPDRRLNEDDGEITVKGLGSVQVDGSQAVDLRVFTPAGDSDWKTYLETLKKESPLIVFSKSYCPYSKRAKSLLLSYQLSPPPLVVELDLRSDGPIIQEILGRLAGRSTVPNILLHGDSIGGSDDIHRLHEEGKLKTLLQEGGMRISN